VQRYSLHSNFFSVITLNLKYYFWMMRTFFKISVIFCSLVSISSSFSQIGFKLSHTRPRGEAGALLKTGLSPEFLFLPEFDRSFRGRVGLSFTGYKPRADRFMGYELIDSGNGIVVHEQYSVVNHYRTYFVNPGFDFTFRYGDEFFVPYIGVDFVAGITNFNYTTYKYQNDYGDETNFITANVGVRGRLGFELNWNLFSVFFEASSGFTFSPESGYFYSNDFALGFRF
jgi:hypothetical protein